MNFDPGNKNSNADFLLPSMCQYQICEQSYFPFFLLLQILFYFLFPLSLLFDFIFQTNEKRETLVSISSTFYVRIFRKYVVFSIAFFYVHTFIYIKKAAEKTFIRKIRAYNVDEIDI